MEPGVPKLGQGCFGVRGRWVWSLAKRTWESCQVGAAVCASSVKDPCPPPGH